MKYITLLIPFFILSCGTDADVPDEDVFEAYRIGTWEVVAADSAQWLGAPAKFKSQEGDTIIVATPDDLSMNMVEGGSQVKITITDSTFTYDAAVIDRGVYYTYEIPNELDPVRVINVRAHGYHVDPDWTKINLSASYSECNYPDTPPDIDHFYVSLHWKDTEELIHSYKFLVDGFVDTLIDIHCD